MNYLLVITSCPDQDTTDRIAEHLIGNQLAACAHSLPGGWSYYHWQGETHRDAEHQLLIKTRAAAFEAVQEAILSLHPYELPEIIAVPIDKGLPAYLSWIDKQVKN